VKRRGEAPEKNKSRRPYVCRGELRLARESVEPLADLGLDPDPLGVRTSANLLPPPGCVPGSSRRSPPPSCAECLPVKRRPHLFSWRPSCRTARSHAEVCDAWRTERVRYRTPRLA
jgi:hypothetical protein